MTLDGLQVILTKHAIERLAESNLTLPQGLEMIKNAISEPNYMPEYKHKKYKDEAFYLRNGTFIFTCIQTMDKIRHFEIILVVTVTNQLITSGVKI